MPSVSSEAMLVSALKAYSSTSGVRALMLWTTLQTLGSMSSMLVMTTWPSTSGSILPWVSSEVMGVIGS